MRLTRPSEGALGRPFEARALADRTDILDEGLLAPSLLEVASLRQRARTARKGDTFLVSKVDRLAGTTPDLFEFSRLDRVGRTDQSAHIRMESVEWNDFGTTPDASAGQFIARCAARQFMRRDRRLSGG
jgi:hypothetical protein